MGRLLLLLLPAVALASQISVKAVVKKDGEVLSVFSKKGCKVVEKGAPTEGKVLFSDFRVLKRDGKLLIEWKAADPSVEKVVVITDGGRIVESTEKNLEITLKGEKLISVYPVSKGGVWGLPATVRFGG